MEASRTLSPCGGGANSSAALCGFLSPSKLWSLSVKDFAWHLGVHCAPWEIPLPLHPPLPRQRGTPRRELGSHPENLSRHSVCATAAHQGRCNEVHGVGSGGAMNTILQFLEKAGGYAVQARHRRDPRFQHEAPLESRSRRRSNRRRGRGVVLVQKAQGAQIALGLSSVYEPTRNFTFLFRHETAPIRSSLRLPM